MRTANPDVFENKGRPPHGTGGCGGTTLVLPVCLIPGVPKRCSATIGMVDDLVGAGASGSGAHPLTSVRTVSRANLTATGSNPEPRYSSTARGS